jgi:carbon starvation protein
MTIQAKLLWAGVAVLGAISLAIVALTRGEPVNAAWLVAASVCIYFIAYRFYALFIANKVLGVDVNRATPAYRHNDPLRAWPDTGRDRRRRRAADLHHRARRAGSGRGDTTPARIHNVPGR